VIRRFLATPFLLLACFGVEWAMIVAGYIMFKDPVIIRGDTDEEI